MVQPVLMPLKTLEEGGGQEYYISMGHGHVLEEKVQWGSSRGGGVRYDA